MLKSDWERLGKERVQYNFIRYTNGFKYFDYYCMYLRGFLFLKYKLG